MLSFFPRLETNGSPISFLSRRSRRSSMSYSPFFQALFLRARPNRHAASGRDGRTGRRVQVYAGLTLVNRVGAGLLSNSYLQRSDHVAHPRSLCLFKSRAPIERPDHLQPAASAPDALRFLPGRKADRR